MDTFHSIILGIVQGITEFLPISSTGHLILAEKLLAMNQTDFLKSFDIIIQFGSILAVIVLYWKKFLHWETLKKLAAAFIPTGILGLLLYKAVKTWLLGNEKVVLWTLFIGGVLLIAFELFHKEKPEAKEEIADLSYSKAAIIGLFQAIAMIPGVSRSAATILGGLLLGIKRKTIVEFSFLLAVPTMLCATGLDLFKSAGQFNAGQWDFLLAGFAASFIMAMIGIKFLLTFIKKYSFISFGVYRIILAAVFWLFVL